MVGGMPPFIIYDKLNKSVLLNDSLTILNLEF